MKFSKILPIMLSAFAGLASAAAKANDDLPSTDAVMNIFKQINKVPRPSKHEEKMVDWLENFAKTNKIEYVIDGKNVIMYKDGTTGMEKAPMLTLQGHMDMVAVHADNYDFDIYTQGVESEIVDGWMRSKDNKTSLGADDGIGISIMLAVLESNTIPHGPLECLFTWDEEQGFSGATALTPGILKGKYLMNIDWETDEELCIGTAGGMGVAANLVYNVTATPDDYAAYKLSIIDVTGGHSGVAINKNPANANKLMSDFLAKQEGLRLSSINGGTFFNAITVKSEATVLVPEKNKKSFEKEWETYATEVKEQFVKTDPDMKLHIKSAETPAESVTEEHTKAIFAGLTNAPSGVTEWSKVVDEMFEVSNNIGPIRLEDGKFRVEMLVRGFNDQGIVDLADDIIKGFKATKVGFECEKYSSFSPWNADLDSSLMHYARKVYEDYFGKPVGLKKIGGGLELSEFALAYPDVPMMSYGPTIVDPHTINEKIKVDTIGHIWDYTLELLRNFNEITGTKEEEDVVDSDNEAVEVSGAESVTEEDSADEATEAAN